MDHKHGPKCGCKEYANIENSSNLYTAIDLAGIACLNESIHGKGRSVFREEEQQFDEHNFVESDDPDPEMIFIIPFIYEVKLKSINIIAKNVELAPNFLKVYINQENVDFSIAEQKGLEEFRIVPNLDGLVHQSVRQSKFQNVTKLILYISSENASKEKIGISYIGLKGDMTKIKRQIVNAVYEIKPLAEDKNPEKLMEGMMKQNYF